MECKYIIVQSKHRITFVLIETLWNVNNYEGLEGEGTNGVLIETLWNVNFNAAGGYSNIY